MLNDHFVSFCTDKKNNDLDGWEQIMIDNPDQKAIFLEAQRLIRLLHGGLEKEDVNTEIEKVRQALNNQSVRANEIVSASGTSLPAKHDIEFHKRSRVFNLKRIIAYGAAACLLLFILFRIFDPGISSSSSDIQQIATHQILSLLGERKNVNLPDGSVVMLNSNSSISYTSDFNQKSREISLTGEAFFVVAKDQAKPFIVTSGNISTTALGTEFFIKSERDEPAISISLLEGKVRVVSASNKQPLFLNPGEMAKSEDGNTLNKETFDSTWLKTWIKGKIVFNKTPVKSAIRELEKWYGTDITINDEGLKHQTITGAYDQATLQDILKVICFSLGRTYHISGNKIIIE